MLLNRTIQQGKVIYSTNNTKKFNSQGTIDNSVIKKCINFAYAMSFGAQGEHRANRTGGQNRRRKGEIFCDAFNGKLGEFAVHQFYSSQGIHFSEPDLEVYGLGQWDETDFFSNGYCISVKTTKSYGNLLLLEKDDWDQNGCYIPNYNNQYGGRYDAIILVRIDSDIDKRFKNNRKYYSDAITTNELNDIFNGFICSYDIPGYISLSMLQTVINNNQIIEQGSYLGRNTPMDATNYYIQSGDLININNLVIQLANNINSPGNIIPII